MLETRFERGGDQPLEADRAILGGEVQVQPEGPHLGQQHQVGAAAPAVEHLTAADQTGLGRPGPLHEHGGQPHPPGHQQVDVLRRRRREAGAERPQHRDRLARARPLEQRRPAPDGLGQHLGGPAGGIDGKQRKRTGKQRVALPITAQHHELPGPGFAQRVATLELDDEIAPAERPVLQNFRFEVAHRDWGAIYPDRDAVGAEILPISCRPIGTVLVAEL